MQDVSRPKNFERSDADPRLVSAIAIGVAVFLIGAPFLVLASYRDAGGLGRIPANLPLPPTPRLQVVPEKDLQHLRASEDARLDTYGWVDRDHNVVRVPISRAMKLLSERGLNGWPSPASR